MRLWAWIPRFGSVFAPITILAGCAAPSVDSVPAPSARAILVRPGRAGFVVAARADHSAGADAMAREIADQTGFGLVVIARPARGDTARELAEAYARAAIEAARGPVRFLVDLREGVGSACAGPMRIATVGVNTELAARLRVLAELIRDAHLRVNPEIARLTVVVDTTDAVTVTTPNTRAGLLGVLRPERALSIELPPCARRDWREMYGAVLSAFVAEAAALAAGR